MLTCKEILFDGCEATPSLDYRKGVYCWVNLLDGKYYVGMAGGSGGLRNRVMSEISALRSGESPGTRLLHEAVVRDGLSNFRVYLVCIHTGSPRELGFVEKGVIAALGSVYPHGYNLSEGGAGCTGSSPLGTSSRLGRPNPAAAEARSKVYNLVSPEGVPRNVHNLAAFCRVQGLSESSLRSVIAGRSSSHRGWSSATISRESYYRKLSSEAFFVSPDGELVKVLNIKNFAKEHGLSQGSLNGVWSQRKHYLSCKGWRRASSDEISSFDPEVHRFWEYEKWK